MSEFSNFNLALGVIGTITGAIALFVSYWTYRKENPHLKVTVLKCEHAFTLSTSQTQSLSFWVDFEIRNVGDRGTSINDIGLLFRTDGVEYEWKKKYFRGLTSESQKRWLEAHDTLKIEADFYDVYVGEEKEQIKCTFTIYHTHPSEKIEALSQRRKS